VHEAVGRRGALSSPGSGPAAPATCGAATAPDFASFLPRPAPPTSAKDSSRGARSRAGASSLRAAPMASQMLPGTFLSGTADTYACLQAGRA
jgi:hypothetical protein